MDSREKLPANHRLEIILGKLLRAGVIVAGVVVFFGGAIYLVHHGFQMPQYEVFRGEPTDLRNVPGIIASAYELSARAIIQLGFLILIATPIARVAFSAYVFIGQKDKTYILVTLFVLGALIFSLAGGRL
jgi:uncharacterized membrane protein